MDERRLDLDEQAAALVAATGAVAGLPAHDALEQAARDEAHDLGLRRRLRRAPA
jgi:hypothetical protein